MSSLTNHELTQKVFKERSPLIKMADKDYRSLDALAQSALNMFIKSPKSYKDMKDNGTDETKAMRFGSAFHSLILEPEDYKKIYLEVDCATEAAKIFKDTQEANPDKICLTRSDSASLAGMARSLTSHSLWKEIEKQILDVESVCCWYENFTDHNVRAKAKVDIRTKNSIIDLKTTQDASSSFKYSLLKYGYHRQAAWYLDGVGCDSFYFVAVEKGSPYNIGIYKIGETYLKQARVEITDAVNRLQTCIKENNWPTYNQEQIETLELTNGLSFVETTFEGEM